MPKKPTTPPRRPTDRTDEPPCDDERRSGGLHHVAFEVPKAGGAGLLIDNISAERIGDAIRTILEEFGPTPERALISIVARELGFYQATAKTRRVIGEVLAEAVERGDVREVEDLYELVS